MRSSSSVPKGSSGGAWTTASSLAQRPEVQFVHLISGGPDTVALAWCPANRVVDLLAHEFAQVPGNASMTSMPVVRYFRTLHDWEPGILTEKETQQLRQVQPVIPWPSPDAGASLSRSDHRLIDALRKDGRCSFEELGRLAGVSEQTAARRVKQLREDGTVAVRAVVDPAELGLPVGVILWLRAKPVTVERARAPTAGPAGITFRCWTDWGVQPRSGRAPGQPDTSARVVVTVRMARGRRSARELDDSEDPEAQRRLSGCA